MAPVTFKDRAIQTLAQGNIPVIRVKPREKKAFDVGWPSLATTDLRVIAAWDKETPDANLGCVAKAELNGFWFFEIDSLDVVQRIEAETGQKIPPTYRVQSQIGRYHYYWKQTPESISAGNIAQGDVEHGDWSARVNNEYVVGALSINPTSGEPYIVVEDSPIVECPSWLISWIRAQKKSKQKAAADDFGPIPDGRRNTTLTSIAGKLRGAGLAQEDIEAHLSKVNSERCVPPLPANDIKVIAGSICRYPVTDPANEVAYVGSSEKVAAVAQSAEILPLVSVDGDIFIKENIPRRKALLRLKDKKSPIFFEQSINQIFAWRGLGKTCIGFGLTGAFAKAGSMLNWEAPERCRVLYVEGELPASQAQERWKQIIGETKGYARLITIDKQPGNTIPSLATAVGMARIEKTLAQLESDGFKTDVLILDSISTLFNISANDEDPWLTIQSWLIGLRSRGLCIFFFHHAGKSGMSRSHSKSEDMLDVSIKLDFPKEPDTDCLHVLMHYDKARAGFSDPDAEVKMHRVHSHDCQCQKKPGLIGCPGDRVKWEFKAPGDQKRFEAEQRFRSGKSNESISEELDIVPSTVRNWRKKWTDKTKKLTVN